MSLRIEDYALIGDCETAALVSLDGSLDWLCWPDFDSDACFAALLGEAQNGRWTICAREPATLTRRYRGDTLILETSIVGESGEALVIDFMPPRGNASDVVRIVRGVRGRVAMRTELIVRFGFGAAIPWVSRTEDGRLRMISGPDMVLLDSEIDLQGEGMTSVAEFEIGEGQDLSFVLTYGPSYRPAPGRIDVAGALADTEGFWSDWVSRGRHPSRWGDAVRRSLITLKALTFVPTGGIVAAPTTSLPEFIGGERNWDYRFCWLRDASLTLTALMTAGHFDEAEAWRDWLVRAIAGSPEQIQIMYGIHGDRRLPEWEVGWLPGYEHSRPVRVGNGAHGQRQLDVFGEVADALYQARHGGLGGSDIGWRQQLTVLAHLETIWREPDEGIWEVRGGAQHFTFSKVMAWVAFDRAVRICEEFGREGPIEHWREIRRTIHDDVCRNGFDPALNSFVQSYGSKRLDASLLLLPTFGFLPADDPRVRGTVAAVDAGLRVDGLVLRYRTEAEDVDGLPKGEGAFLACSFWLVDAYVMLGRVGEACALFEELLALRNDVGLLAEEYDKAGGRQLGNFPQAFSHVALVNSAFNLAKALDSGDIQPDRPAAA